MRRHLLAAAILALAPLPLAAQTAPSPAASATTTPAAGMRVDPAHIRAKQLMDRDVYTTDGTQVGEIEDLIVDPASGRIVSAVIEVETRLGLTDRYVALDLNRLRLTPGERRVTVDMTRDAIRSLPGIAYRD